MDETICPMPRFARPPVVETVLGVHFRPLESFASAQQGMLWERCFRSQFPRLEERPPVEEVRERFGEDRLSDAPTIRWRVMDRPDVPRLWAASEDGQYVLQIQRNGLFLNWLKTDMGVAYPPYLKRRDQFRQELDQVDRFLQEETIGRLEPTSCVVTYVNHIDYGGLEDIGPAVARILTCGNNESSDGWLPLPDNAVLTWGFPIPGQSGRLNVELRPIVRRSDRKEMLQLGLTARGTLKTREVGEAVAWIDLGHEWVVRGFASLTRPEMHRLWERIE